jgi:hypothetical protein
MSELSPIVEYELYVGLDEGAYPDEIDELTRNLLEELREGEVESADLAVGGVSPSGSKAADPLSIGVILVAVLPNLLPKLLDFVQAWSLRGQGRVVKFKGKVAGQEIEFEGTAQELKDLLTILSAVPTVNKSDVTTPIS